jgi:hypothetical protein
LLAFFIEEASAKIRTGPPLDDEEDYSLLHWAGVLPVERKTGKPIPDSRLAMDSSVPECIQAYRRRSEHGQR